MKPSGLADSPFFRATQRASSQSHAEPDAPSAPPIFERSPAPANERSNERTIERSPERAPERTYRRYTYDLFDDQVDAIDELTFRWRKTQGKHVTKGYVIRKLLDIALKTEA